MLRFTRMEKLQLNYEPKSQEAGVKSVGSTRWPTAITGQLQTSSIKRSNVPLCWVA